MKLEVGYQVGCYFIIAYGNGIRLTYDYEIANKLGVTLEYYHNELLNFGGIIKNEEVYFSYYDDAKKVLQYLKDKYDIIIALMG